MKNTLHKISGSLASLKAAHETFDRTVSAHSGDILRQMLGLAEKGHLASPQARGLSGPIHKSLRKYERKGRKLTLAHESLQETCAKAVDGLAQRAGSPAGAVGASNRPNVIAARDNTTSPGEVEPMPFLLSDRIPGPGPVSVRPKREDESMSVMGLTNKAQRSGLTARELDRLQKNVADRVAATSQFKKSPSRRRNPNERVGYAAPQSVAKAHPNFWERRAGE